MAEPTSGHVFEKLLTVMERLRGEGGCPWDREQTRQSLTPFLIEEAHEVVEAIETGSAAGLMEELGDLLFQVVFHAQLAQERGEFTMSDLLAALIDKMVRRHPHVFGDATVTTATEALAQWEHLKQSERKTEATRSLLDGIPQSLPALLRAHRVQSKSSRVGFDWNTPEEAWEKVREEVGEFERSLQSDEPADVEEEVGDLLFSLVNVTRLLGLNAEICLQRATRKFQARFAAMEADVRRDGQDLGRLSLEEMERRWQAGKARERSDPPTSPRQAS
ncbi:MAG: nucleoside triphosphate pyrophosphohydrolase [Candidatus Rokubacteria bacterium]|nr:nucleoside triphosphate pyrophosphohydrolase [Candidatus Rokubacteria bacterium]